MPLTITSGPLNKNGVSFPTVRHAILISAFTVRTAVLVVNNQHKVWICSGFHTTKKNENQVKWK
jgi:hypothetical protein